MHVHKFETLIGKKMRRWCLIAQYNFVDPTCPPSRARRNYWRLCARYPELMSRLRLSYLSVYEPY